MRYTFSDVCAEIGYYLRAIFLEGSSFKMCLAAIPALFSSTLLGEWYFFQVWFICNVIDLVLGVALALVTKDPDTGRSVFSRARLYGWVVKTLTHVGTIYLFGIVTVMVSKLAGHTVPFIDWFMGVLILTEMASITSSASKLGLPVHPLALLVLRKLKRGAEGRIKNLTNLNGEDLNNDKDL